MANGVAHTDTASTGLDRDCVQAGDGLRSRPGRVLSDKHNRHTAVDSELHCIFAMTEHSVEGPVLSILTDRTGADETGNFDRDTHLVGNFDYRFDVSNHGTGGAVGTDAEAFVADLLSQPLNIGALPVRGSWKTERSGIDTKAVHQMEDLQLIFDVRIACRG